MKFLKKLRTFDLIIIGVLIVALLVGMLTMFGKRATSSNQIETTADVEIEIFLRSVTVSASNNIFEAGDETFITIRNVPYTKLKIKDVKYDRKKAIVPTFNTKKPFTVVDDVTAPYQYDFLITVVDKAKITKDRDGAVVGGNKIKIGLPITLEGSDYKLNGIVSNITVVAQPNETNDADLEEQVNQNQDVQ